MADEKTRRGVTADRARVSVMEDYEVKYLAQKHSVTQKAVKEAVAKVGHMRNRVEAELKANKPAAKAAPAKTAPAKKGAAKKASAANAAPAKKAPAKKAPSKKVAAKKAPAKSVAME